MNVNASRSASQLSNIFPMHHDTITANRIIITRPDGQPAIILGTSDSDSLPLIELYDGSEPQIRASVQIDGMGPLIAIHHPNGNLAANLRLFDDGRVVCGVYGPDEYTKSVVIAIDENKQPMVEVRDNENRVQFHAP